MAPAAGAGAATTAVAAAAFEAFEPSVVVDEFARRITALAVWRDAIVASLHDGSLLFFEQLPAAAPGGGDAPPQQHAHGGGGGATAGDPPLQLRSWQVTRLQKGFSRRGAAQLQALEGQPFLLSLTDEAGVQLHSLPEGGLVSGAPRTAKAAVAFSWDEGRQLLATATKNRKVLTHQLDRASRSLQELAEYSLPEAASALAWVGSNLLAGTPKAYWLIAPAPPQTVEVLPGQSMTIWPTVAPQQLFSTGSGSHAPLIARVGPEEVLVSRDASAYFLGPDGKPSRKLSLTWSQPPRLLLASSLYAVALLPSAVEVKGIARGAAAAAEQMLLLPNMAVAAPTPAHDGCLYIASGADGGIRQLRPLPLERQARLLAAAGDFQGALELLTVLEDAETAAAAAAGGASSPGSAHTAAAAAAAGAAKRQQLEDVLRLRYGYHLFEGGDYDEALTQFSMCSQPDPLLLLRLYPDLVPAKFQSLLPRTAYGEPLPEPGGSGSDAAGGDSGSQGSKQQQQRDERARAAAVAVVVPYLLSHRTRLLSSLAASTGSSGSSKPPLRTKQQQQSQGSPTAGGGSSGGGSSSSNGSSPAAAAADAAAATTSSGGSPGKQQRSVQELRLLAAVIDTAIMRAMLLQADSGALLRLVQQPNYADLEDGQTVLAAAGRYAELAALYQYHARHEQGLALLQALSQDPASLDAAPTGAAADLKGLPGVWAAVRYLVAVTPADLTLLSTHAGWILEADPEAGLEALLCAEPPLSHTFALPLLEAHAPAYTAVYLESALELGQVAPKEVHSELLLIYLALALEEERDGQASCEAHARALSLSDLLVSRPHVPLKLFPDDITLWAAPGRRKQQAMAAAPATPPSPAAAAARDGGSDTPPAASRPAAVVVTPPRYEPATLAAPHHPHHRRDAYQRLRELVYASPHIDPDYVLSKLGQGELLEIRALMLERLGRHREALGVYVHDLGAMTLAEEYCDRVYDAGVAAAAAAAAVARSAAAAAAAADNGGAALLPPPPPTLPMAGGWGGSAAAAKAAAAGRGEAPKWHKVQLAQQQSSAKQQQQREGSRAGLAASLGQRSWSALPFGAKPQDIYMELVDAVLQGSNGQQRSTSGLPSPPAAAAAAATAGRGGKRKQQQQQQDAAGGSQPDRQAWKQLAELLARKSDRINHLQVLGVLPLELPLGDVSPLLASMLTHNTEAGRNTDVVLHLRRAENLMAREDLVKVKQRAVPLTFDRACCICHKRMGGAVSVAYPAGTLAHYLCYKRTVQQQLQSALGTHAAAAAGQQQQQQQWGAGGLPAGLLPGLGGGAGGGGGGGSGSRSSSHVAAAEVAH